jgi:LPXTG-motif cell wall-anchored protein
MRWHKIGRILVVCGVLMVTFGVSVLPAQGAETTQSAQQPLLAPSPRPTLGPTRPRGDSHAGTAAGRITGTIIDLTTGAPTPGVQVSVGGTIVTSDANGNYDLWVPVGAYNITLVLSPETGAPDQGAQIVDIAAGQTTVLHLNFHTPLAPSATPVAPSATAVPAKPATPVEGRARNRNTPRSPVTPRLPRTGEQESNAWLWMTFGMLLVMGGVALEYGRKRRLAFATASAGRVRSSYDNARLLARLLAANMQHAQPVRARGTESDILLAALLSADTGEE